MVRAVFSIITTLLAVGAAARSTGLSPLRSLKFFCVDRWLQPQCTTQRLQIAAVASLRGGGGDGEVRAGSVWRLSWAKLRFPVDPIMAVRLGVSLY
jgi:hypothetical protein